MDKVECSVQGCALPVRCEGLCHKHYNRTKYSAEKQSHYDRLPMRRFRRHERYCNKKGIPLGITFSQWQEIVKDNKCYYCPNPLPTNGIALDRKYPGVGYIFR